MTCYSPGEISAMSIALERAWRALPFAYGVEGLAASRAKERLAALILEISSEGERDPQALCDLALRRFPPVVAHYLIPDEA